MRITDLFCWKEKLPLKVPYTIAFETFSETTIIFIAIRLENGLMGIGSGAPAPSITGESIDESYSALEQVSKDVLTGQSIDGFKRMILESSNRLKGFPAALCAIDTCLHDVFAQHLKVPLVQLFGQVHKKLPTSITIGIKPLNESLEEANQRIQEGFRIIKLKIGKDYQADLETYIKLKEALPKDILIRVDANQGYNSEKLLDFIQATQSLAPEFFEQPFPPGQYDALMQLPESVRALIAADEDLHIPFDAIKLSHPENLVGIFNIKLMKCGGVLAARKIATLAEVCHKKLMWGCMDESIVSISAALHVAFSSPATQYLDLDGSFDLARDVVEGGFHLENGMMSPLGRPGLGLNLLKSIPI